MHSLKRGEEDASTHLFTSKAQKSLAPPFLSRSFSEEAGGDLPKIPVLVELRYYQTSVLDLIRNFLRRHRLRLQDAEIDELLFQGRFLLLVDGLNELPSEEARRDLKAFRLDNPDTPMVFTTRDLGVGGDLDIDKKLEMQPLTEEQMRKFVRAYLPQQGEQMLLQLGSRLHEFGQTPLLLKMLCDVFVDNSNRIPPNLGSVFRQFAQTYDRKLKQDVPVANEYRLWCPRLLEHLAWVMTNGKAPTELQIAISRHQAEAVLTKFLQGKVAYPESCALSWIEDLLKHHLIQPGANDQIEFRHQLIQEYYTAECLLKVLTPPGRTSPPTPLLQGEGLGGLGLSDDELKRDYLNYLKWTEPLALMLELVEDEAQVVRVVKLALEVDLRLGARLAGAVKPEWQEPTVGLVAGLKIPQLLKIKLLNITKSEKAIPELVKPLNDEDSAVRRSAVSALGKIGSEAVIPELVKALNDEDSGVHRMAASALGKIGSDAAIAELVKALRNEGYSACRIAASTLGKIGSDVAIAELVKALNHKVSIVRWSADYALSKIGSDAAIPELVKALDDEDSSVRWSADYTLSKIGSDTAIPELVKALDNEDPSVRWSAADALGKIASPKLLPDLSWRLKTDKETKLLNTISAIQERCKFYNYTLTQPTQMEDKPKSDVKRDQVFISYSHKDKKYLEKLQLMLAPLLRNKTISVWDDTNIQVGAKWREEIEKALAAANVAVLMVSQNFLASDFIMKHELPPILNAAEQEGLKIIWVPVSVSLYEYTEIGEYQAAHNPSQPLDTLTEVELNQALVKICKQIKAVAAE